ncbi:hypothetical protein [Aquisphaera giovannonii]|uniref:hypothetical protein n=1 Tax=Aquisphaera giovannonii TaxID=406548 RepID=UPI001AEF5BCD|nr:hypothetical protein [Aquisphaera giovannonii]
MSEEIQGAVTVRIFADLDRWPGHAVRGLSDRHQLWIGPPGKGKTARVHRDVANSICDDPFAGMEGRVAAAIYTGRITAAQWFVRGWQHRLEPLLVLNDVTIGRGDAAWRDMLLQFMERPGRRTIRWDNRSGPKYGAEDLREIEDDLRSRDLLDRLLGVGAGTDGASGREPEPSPVRSQEVHLPPTVDE